MPRLRTPVEPDVLAELADSQGGAVSRRQLADLGMNDEQIARELAGGRWQRSDLPGVYLTFTGPVPFTTRCWAGVLYAGDGATLCLETAARIWKLDDEPPDEPPDVHVMIEGDRRVTSQPGVKVHIRVHLARRRHPARLPPVVRLEETVIDLIDRPVTTQDAAIDLLLRACQRRLTQPDRLLAAAGERAKMRHRALMVDVLADVSEGVQSALERRYLRDVERAHGLPRAERNRPERTRAERSRGRRSYRDVRYMRYGLVVELDGRAAHPGEDRERDDLRDNALVEEEDTRTLRYGWRSVASRPCKTAGRVPDPPTQPGRAP